jgi:diphthamide synthase (EF-2-diphthine--ammonia ligase)
VDSRALDASFAGCEMDPEFFKALPAGVDPCGENGEFHSFVYDGPLFKDRLRFTKGEVMQRGTFYYCDLTAQ